MNKILSIVLLLISLTTAYALIIGKAPLIKVLSMLGLLITVAALNARGGIFARWVGYVNGLLFIVFALISAEVVLFPEPGNDVDYIFLTLSVFVGFLGVGTILGIKSAAKIPVLDAAEQKIQ